MNVFELFATLGIDTSAYDAGLGEAEKKGSNFGQTLGTVVATGGKIAVSAIAATTAATIAGTAAFVNGVASVAEYGDNIEKTSQKLGISSEKFQEWDYVMNIAGTSMNSMQMGMKTLTNQLDAAKNGSADAISKFEALGLSLEDIQNMSREEIFEAAIYGFQGMGESAERAALANDLFGKSGQELIPLFNMTAEETQELIQKANEYGMVMSDEAVEASATFQDSLTTMQKTLAGLKNSMLAEFLPAISTIMDGLAAVFAGDNGGLALIDEGVNDFIVNLNEVAPKALEIGANILNSLISAISKNLPKLISQGSGILNELIQGIIIALPSLLESAMLIISQVGSALLENAGLLMSTAFELIMMLATGLTEAIPTLIPALTTVISGIVLALTSPDTLVMLVNAALQLILALADGLIAATPELVGLIPIIYVNIVTAMIEGFPMVLDAVITLLGDLGAEVFAIIGGLMGMNSQQISQALVNVATMLQNAFSNMVNGFTSFRSNLINIVSTLWSSITGFFQNGLNSAKNTVTNVLNSIKNTFTNIFNGVKTTVENAINFIKGLFDFEWSLPDIKLPHFSISGKLDLLASPPTYPSVSVSWYDKAMDTPYLLNGATIFGAQNGRLLGGGESGSEIVIGTNKLMSMMKEAVGIGSAPVTINVYGAEGQDIRELAKEVSKEFQYMMQDKEKAYGIR